MAETLALQLPAALSVRVRQLAQAAALPVDYFVVQALSATLEGDVGAAVTAAPARMAGHQEAVLMVLHRMAGAAQARMNDLMARNTEGNLTASEEEELTALVAAYEQIMLANSQQLLRVQQLSAHLGED
ncbi:MAG: hypothetical protein R2911_28365 [Caldilineaceae bacterium]